MVKEYESVNFQTFGRQNDRKSTSDTTSCRRRKQMVIEEICDRERDGKDINDTAKTDEIVNTGAKMVCLSLRLRGDEMTMMIIATDRSLTMTAFLLIS